MGESMVSSNTKFKPLPPSFRTLLMCSIATFKFLVISSVLTFAGACKTGNGEIASSVAARVSGAVDEVFLGKGVAADGAPRPTSD
jgi:hypothetical protein